MNQYAAASYEFARKISVELNMTSKDFVENVTDILSKIKIKAGSLGELGLQIERELRNIANADALEFHTAEIAKDGNSFVILIDDLDLGWDNSKTANDLLLGLLTATNHLSSLSPNIFTCIFLREDIYAILMKRTQHSDKYRNIERIRWSKDALLNILAERITYNFKKSENQPPAHPIAAVFPETIGTSNTDNWLYDRTLSRPRELIQLSRFYTETTTGDIPNDSALKDAESQYSSWKLDDLCTEYSNQYPELSLFFATWKAKFYRHKYHLQRSDIDSMLYTIFENTKINNSWWATIVESKDTEAMLNILYEIGFLGDFVLGGAGGSKIVYSHLENHEPRFEEVQIHPCFRKAVNTVERIRG